MIANPYSGKGIKNTSYIYNGHADIYDIERLRQIAEDAKCNNGCGTDYSDLDICIFELMKELVEFNK